MKRVLSELKAQISEYHTEVAYNVLTLKNVFDLRAIIPLIITFFLAMKVWQLLAFTGVAFYFLDFITGALATQSEYKKSPEKYEEAVKRKGKLYWVESDRIVRGIVKGSIYFVIIITSVVLTVLLNNKAFELHATIIPLSPFEISLILINVSEMVSNLENGKRAGFDLVGKIKNFFLMIWNIKNVIKTGKDDEVSN